jgi:HPt (histidine-containing phosphotransfer) domain-containing protein
MGQTNATIVNWTTFGQTRALIGAEFTRILGFYREDAAKNVVAVEQAFRARDAVAMVRPAHTLKGDSLQFGGEALGRLAEHIEHTARQCVEDHRSPDELELDIPRLRPLLIETLGCFEREINAATVTPLRRPAMAAGFGRKGA